LGGASADKVQKISSARLIGSQMAFGTGDYTQAGDTFLLSRVMHELLRSGRLELRMPSANNAIRVWRKELPLEEARWAEVRLPRRG
jgi:hypothetical protein